MASTQFGGFVTPDGSQKVAVPADMKVLADGLDARVNLLAANENDRNTRYSNVPAGTQVSTPDGWQWLKVTNPPDAPEWIVLQSIEVYTGFNWVAGAGFVDNGHSQITRVGPNYDVFIGANYQGAADIETNDGGFMGDRQICSIVDATWRPISGQSRTFAGNGGADFGGQGICYGVSGTINVSSGNPNNAIRVGDSINLSFTFQRQAGS